MNNGLDNLPPGVQQRDIGSDDYVCECCGETFTEDQIDESCEAGDVVCKRCARIAKEEEAK